MIKKIKALLEEGVKNNHFPGASFCIVTGNEIILDNIGYKQTYPNKVLKQNNEIYDIASLTKVVSTTTLVLQLVENKQLSLGTKVSDCLPWFRFQNITIRDLLTHSSGLPADISRAKTLRNRDEVIDRVKELDLIYPTGEKIVYSDVGFIILGLIIETIYKKPLSKVAEQQIFLPLGMNDTTYHPQVLRCSPTELRDDNVYKGLLQGLVHDEKAFAMQGVSGHAGLFSTAYDLGLFVQSIINNKSVIKKETIELLFNTTFERSNLQGNPLRRTLGFDKPLEGTYAGDYFPKMTTIGHTGFTGCNIIINKERQIGFVLLSNAVHPKRENNNIFDYRYKISNLIYKEAI